MIDTIFIPEHKCTCGYEMDATAQYGGESKPSAGDASICFNCKKLWVFNADLTMREPNPSEQESFANDPDIAKALAAIDAVKEVKVVDWIADNETGEREVAVGGMGGWFGVDQSVDLNESIDDEEKREKRWNAGHRWKDYIESFKPHVRPYLEAIRADVVVKGIRMTGEQHQYSDSGTPVFSDGKIASFSYRGWGDLMAAIWAEAENKNYSYMDFYM